jgi:hypothetical protein
MPVAKTIMKKTHQEAIVKVAGTAAAATIDLSADLVAAGQVLDGDVQKVSITGVNWTGASDGIVTIARNSVTIMTLQANAAGMMYFDGQSMIPDNIEEASDIVVTVSGAQAECWLKLRKVSGYKTTIEPEQFGPYDNPAVAGS